MFVSLAGWRGVGWIWTRAGGLPAYADRLGFEKRKERLAEVLDELVDLEPAGAALGSVRRRRTVTNLPDRPRRPRRRPTLRACRNDEA